MGPLRSLGRPPWDQGPCSQDSSSGEVVLRSADMNTTNVSSAEVRAFDYVAERTGKWLMHCHFSHHTMNDMHRTPLPGQMDQHDHMAAMDMGGMHTWIEIT